MKALLTLGVAAVAAGAVAFAVNRADDVVVDAQDSCDGSCCEAAAANASPAMKASYVEVANPVEAGLAAGTVTGSVTFEGDKPKMDPLAINADAAKGCAEEGHEVDPTDRSLMLSEKGGIANAVVTVSVKGAEVKVPEEPVVLDQKACRYEPHVLVLPVGATVRYGNSDTVSHNVHTYAGRNESLNKTVAPGSKEEQKLEKKDNIEVKCDIHPWMNSYIVVTDDPYVAITDAEGNFSVEGVPAGKHKVNVWHEKLGKAKGEVTVAEDGTVEAIEIKMGAEKKKGKGKRRR
ncbi:MAG: carboxypeptidase regulatory-like domain-containing protein [Planctomycetota bacterium]